MFYEEAADYKSYLPEVYRDILEIDALGETVNTQVDRLSATIKSIADNKFVMTADEKGVSRWEKLLGVSAPLNSTLQARRAALKAKLMSKPPINLQGLKGIIEAYMGLPVDIGLFGYAVKVKYRGESRIADLAPLYATIYEMIPANMLLSIMYLYVTWGEVKSTYPTWGDVKKKTWGQIYKGV